MIERNGLGCIRFQLGGNDVKCGWKADFDLELGKLGPRGGWRNVDPIGDDFVQLACSLYPGNYLQGTLNLTMQSSDGGAELISRF